MESHINALSVLTDISVDDMMPHVEAILTILEKRFHIDDFSTETDRAMIPNRSSPGTASTEKLRFAPATKQKKMGKIYLATTPYEDFPPLMVAETTVSNDIENSCASRNDTLPLESEGENSKNFPIDGPTKGASPTTNAGYQDSVVSEFSNLSLTAQDEVKFISACKKALTSDFMNTSTVTSALSVESFGGEQTSNPPQGIYKGTRWHVPPEILNPPMENQCGNISRGQWNTSSSFLDPFTASPERSFKGTRTNVPPEPSFNLKKQASSVPRPNNFQRNPSPEFTNLHVKPGRLTSNSSTKQNSLPAQRETYDASQSVSFKHPNVLSNEMFPPLEMTSRVGHNRRYSRMNTRPSTPNNPFTTADPHVRKSTTNHSFQGAKPHKRSTSKCSAFLWEQPPSPTEGPNLTTPSVSSFNPLIPSNHMLSLQTSSIHQSDTKTYCFTHVSPSTMPQVPNSFLRM